MTPLIQKRQPEGIPTGGQFAGTEHSEPNITLARLAVNPAYVRGRLRAYGLNGRLSVDQTEELIDVLNAGLDFSDRSIEEAADRILHRDRGYGASDARTVTVLEQELREAGRIEEANALARVAAASPMDYPNEAESTFATEEELAELASRLLPDGIETPVPVSDPRLQSGQVFDKVIDEDGTVFHRRRPGVFAGTPYAMRIQASRPLSEDERNQFASLVGYTYASTIRGESLGDAHPDTPYSFIVAADMTKTRRDDLGQGLDEFETNLPENLQEGTRIRTTNRTGPIGTQAVEGFHDPDLTFEIYYDDIFDPGV
ncbi:hypothetical protein [Arthrobacter caoxuetaonis]|uniref:Uncharacterized protein n=1 Tax=Arthrobacter caoxuetaonis TaxID=2886935 RepID=A0A9X1MH77_9MICC|nr:hypothetical protein [Arthrobacter caoxuetaonis]MCC3299766.1 hypothetical protein [Arthrobacter caoxuetaonis]USQ59333.1 hypothetical protein NF551_17265 [Arthrobacter caoxuetaonis]